MTHLLFLLRDSFLQTFKDGQRCPIPIRGENKERCPDLEDFKKLLQHMLNNEATQGTKISFLLPEDWFSAYAGYALKCADTVRPSAVCLYRLSDFMDSIALENKEHLPSEQLAAIFFRYEDTPQAEEKKPEEVLCPLAAMAQRSKVDPIKRRS